MNRQYQPFPITLPKALVLVLSSFIWMQNTQAQICSNPNIIFGLNSSRQIYPINTTNANVGAQINSVAYGGLAANQSNAIGFSNLYNSFFYFHRNPSTANQKFIEYNATTNTYVTCAPCPTINTVHAGCMSFNGNAYYCIDVQGNLYYYQAALNTWTTITSTILDQSGVNVSSIITTQNSGDMVVDGLGNLWILPSSGSNYSLYELKAPLPTTPKPNVTVQRVIAPTTATPAGQAFEGIAFNALGQIFLTTANDKLYKLSNISTLSLIGTLSTSGVGADLTSCSYPLTILGINWRSVNAYLNNQKVAIEWSIASASDIHGFYVEKSIDEKSWQTVGYFTYTQGEQDYSTLDGSPAPGINYYRIREEDNSGQDNYSSVKMINVSSSADIQIWPNPAKDVVYVQINGKDNEVTTEIFDQLGRRMMATVLHAGNNYVNVSNFPSGTYFIHLHKMDGTVVNQKIIKK